jgi:hypothetical protein
VPLVVWKGKWFEVELRLENPLGAVVVPWLIVTTVLGQVVDFEKLKTLLMADQVMIE